MKRTIEIKKIVMVCSSCMKDQNKITQFNNEIYNQNLNDVLYLEGHFETEKYFLNFKNEIDKEFTFRNLNVFKSYPFYKAINNENSIAICVRQNRFSEGSGKKKDLENDKISWRYTMEQINYINKCIGYFESKITVPKFYLWSNDFTNLNEGLLQIYSMLKQKPFKNK